MHTRVTVTNAAVVFLAIVLYTVAVQAVMRTSGMQKPLPPPKPVACEGDAVVVDYPFQGGYIEPHACQPQCDDGKQRYILYTNGKATQCETPPGCNDWGEDHGITCLPPEMSTQQ